MKLGIRPEHLSESEAGSGAIPLLVYHTEILGADTLLHGRIGAGGPPLTVRMPHVLRFDRDHRLDLGVPPGRLHLFDAGGTRIPLSEQEGEGGG